MTSQNNRAPVPCYVNHFALFQSHLWIQTGVTVQKRSIWVKIGHFVEIFVYYFIAIGQFKLQLQSGNRQFGWKSLIFFVVCDLEISWVTLEKIENLSYATLKFVHHFIAISEFKLELQSRNAQFVSKSELFVLCDLENDRWPYKTIGHLFYATSSCIIS